MEKANAEVKESRNVVEVVHEAFKELKQTVVAFIKAPQALWGINLPYLLEGLVYFGILTELEIFCSANVQLTDPQANWVLSFLTGGITLAMVILGGYSDKIGVRKSLRIAFTILLIGRIILSLSGTLPLGQGVFSPMFFVMLAGLFFVIIGYGLYQPAAYAGIKRYTTPKTKSMGYAVVYALMNLGAFFFGLVAPFIRRPFEKSFPPNGISAVFWLLTVITAGALFATMLLLTKKADQKAAKSAKTERDAAVEAKQETSKTTETKPKSPVIDNAPLIAMAVLTLGFMVIFLLFRARTMQIGNRDSALHNLIYIILILAAFGVTIWEYLRKRPDHPFRDIRFVFFIFILIPVQTLFAHNWLTLPPYLHRAFHGSFVSDFYELFANINPLLIFILAPMVAGLTRRTKIYNMVIYGTFVMALPTFLLATEPNVILFLTYVILMTIGEAMWQPRFLEWIAEIAPEGKTGAYMGIGQLPWFLTKVITGLYAGFFLAAYVPQPSPGVTLQPGKMWFFHGLIAMVSPIALVLAKKWMTSAKNQRNSSL